MESTLGRKRKLNERLEYSSDEIVLTPSSVETSVLPKVQGYLLILETHKRGCGGVRTHNLFVLLE